MYNLIYQSLIVFWLGLAILGAVTIAETSSYRAAFWIVAIVVMLSFFGLSEARAFV